MNQVMLWLALVQLLWLSNAGIVQDTGEAILTYDEEDLLSGEHKINWDMVEYDDEIESIDVERFVIPLYPRELTARQIRDGMDPDKFVHKGNSMMRQVSFLHLAVLRGFARLTKKLLDMGAHPDMDAEMTGRLEYDAIYPFPLAVMFNHFEVAKVLVAEGINVNKQAVAQYTADKPGPDPDDVVSMSAAKDDIPLLVAAERGNLEMFDLLVANGAEVRDVAAMLIAARTGGESGKAIIRRVVDAGVDINLRLGDVSDNILGVVAEENNLDMAKFVVSLGASWQVESKDQLNAYDLACGEQSWDVAKYLREELGAQYGTITTEMGMKHSQCIPEEIEKEKARVEALEERRERGKLKKAEQVERRRKAARAAAEAAAAKSEL